MIHEKRTIRWLAIGLLGLGLILACILILAPSMRVTIRVRNDISSNVVVVCVTGPRALHKTIPPGSDAAVEIFSGESGEEFARQKFHIFVIDEEHSQAWYSSQTGEEISKRADTTWSVSELRQSWNTLQLTR